jgi:hypothetical protein
VKVDFDDGLEEPAGGEGRDDLEGEFREAAS